ncbi:MAG TPA: diguanylate cyclase, partial [Gallionella sp.]|nr:diguanylate cyclase [Gallionella sp.]
AEAKANLKRDMALLLWSTDHGGIYLRVNENIKPSPFLANIPDRDIPAPNGEMLTLQNPVASLREIKLKQGELYGELAHVTGLKYLNSINAPDSWEKKALGIIDKTLQDFSEVTTIDGKAYLRMMQPMIMEEGCMKCHAWTGIKIGELRGGTDIAIPLERYQSIAQREENNIAATHAGILLLGLVLIGFISRQSRLRIQESIQYQQELEHLAYVDSLTGLLNRRRFYELAEQELVRALRHERPLSILMIDVDKFKRINDTYGHATGDRVLQKLSDVFRKVVREIDFICRMGGEEFAILLTETDQVRAMEVAERLRASTENTELNLKGEASLHFTISIGIASLSRQADKIDAIISLADGALYEAKETGRNRVCEANQELPITRVPGKV